MALRSPLTLQPYDYIGNSTGRPLDKGQIYIGVAGQDPEFYQIPVFLDAEMTKPIDQPIRTNDGFVDFAGSLSELYASGEIYSVKILDKEGRTVLYKGDMTRKNLMSDALADLNQSIVDAQSAAQTAIDATANNASIVITNVSTDATAAIDNAVLISNDAASRADSAIQDLFENGGLPATPFSTYTEMTASALVDGSYALVANDNVVENNGYYQKRSGSWAYLKWNILSQVSSIVDANPLFKPMSLSTSSVVDSITDAGIYQVPANSIAVTLGLPSGLQGQLYSSGYSSTSTTSGYATHTYVDTNGDTYQRIKHRTGEWREWNGYAHRAITSTDNLNTLTKKGIYHIRSGVYATSEGNYPFINEGGIVIIDGDGTDVVRQQVLSESGTAQRRGAIVNSVITWTGWLGNEYPKYGFKTNSLLVNQGKDYPLRKMTRDSVTSVANSYLNDALLDVSIVGARPDKIYRIGYLKNGYVGLGDYAYGIAVYEYDKDYTNEFRIIDYRDPAPELSRGGVQSQTVSSVIYTDFSIKLTFDTDKLPPTGTNINLMRDIDPAYSWIIDPSTYQLKLPKNGIYYSINSTDDISFTYQSDSYIYRVTFGKNGYNNLPNVKKIERATTSKPHVWVVVSETATDYLPPMVVRAVNDGDGVTSLYYTGGNHGASGSTGGAQTARNMLYKIKIDGQDAAYQKSGYATSINLHIVNELMAYNTITLSRYVIRQSFNVTLKAGQIIVNSDVKALEPVEITTENGLQLYTGGYQGTMLMLGGQTVNRVAFSTDVSSGKKYLQPNAFATVLINGFDQIAMWMDRTYEAGDGRYVGTSTALIRSGNGTNTKFYNAIVSNSPTTLAKGEGYKWRGGYAIERTAAPTGYDSWFSKDNGFVVAVDASNYSIVD